MFISQKKLINKKIKKKNLTGNCTYFVGNCEGDPSHVKDLSTYVQNSATNSIKDKHLLLHTFCRKTQLTKDSTFH